MHLETIDDYLDAARDAIGKPSDRRLARHLDLKPTSVSAWRTRRSWPSDKAMIALADLLSIPHEQALADVNRWRAQSPEQVRAYARIARRVSTAELDGFFGTGNELLPVEEAERICREQGMSDADIAQMREYCASGFKAYRKPDGRISLQSDIEFNKLKALLIASLAGGTALWETVLYAIRTTAAVLLAAVLWTGAPPVHALGTSSEHLGGGAGASTHHARNAGGRHHGLAVIEGPRHSPAP